MEDHTIFLKGIERLKAEKKAALEKREAESAAIDAKNAENEKLAFEQGREWALTVGTYEQIHKLARYLTRDKPIFYFTDKEWEEHGLPKGNFDKRAFVQGIGSVMKELGDDEAEIKVQESKPYRLK